MAGEGDAMVRMTLKVWQVSVTVVLDYLLMLIAMTFNVGLFAAVILGVGKALSYSCIPLSYLCIRLFAVVILRVGNLLIIKIHS
jgi:hypothetical protein